ncbi:phage tail protein [Dactylosporangium cerinum]|uniref:Phage tail protein n=1 Tax=Dactylosporangium cerinum TaxID=1434730 RepID=A0ABV9VRN5_9ACTN
MNAGELPVGTVLGYAGITPGDLAADGWLRCDGERYDGTVHRELYEAIGFAFGRVASNPPMFNVPDLRGLFIRCTADAATRDDRDPEWRWRSPLAAGGHDRADVGSYQDYGTAPARNGLTAAVNRADVPSTRDDAGCGPLVAEHNDRTTRVPVLGGDLESRPVNKYVHFVIKSRAGAGAPLGAVVPYAGPAGPRPGTWLLCDGAELSRFGPYKALWDAIGYVHGRGEDDTFLLPDHRGWFLRGVSGPAGRDPDRTRRTAAAEGGRQGDEVGSAQSWATAVPTNRERPATVAFQNLPDTDKGKSIAGAIRHVALRNSGSATVTLHPSGGDAESRPGNAAVDFYVVGRPYGEAVPVGTIVTAGGPVPAGGGWLPCDGRLLPVAEHAELAAALDYRWGGSAGTGVQLPDLRGRFLRGADHGTGTDPDANDRTRCGTGKPSEVGSVQGFATGAPRTPFTVAVPYLPTDSRQVHGETRGGIAGFGGARSVSVFEGGNADTRPANVYLNAYIRVR